jgi:hypothetical protein
MRFKTLMALKALACLVFGIALLLFPRALFSIFGITLDPGGMFPAREYGSALFGILMLTWFARNAGDSDARTAIILALFIYDLLGFVVTLMARATGVLNMLGWLVAAIYLLFTFGFGYFLLFKPEITPKT